MKAWQLIAHFLGNFHKPSVFIAGLILVVVAGVVIDGLYCFSGVMILSEERNNRYLIPGTQALSVQTTGIPLFVSLEQNSCPMQGFKIELLNYTPNACQKLKCTRENQITFFALGKNPSSQTLRPTRDLQAISSGLEEDKWQLAAIKAEHIGDIVADIALQTRPEQLPLFSLIQDEKMTEYLLMIGPQGDLSLSSIESLLKSHLVSLNGGRQGYGIQISAEAYAYFKVWPTAVQLPSALSAQDNTPCAHICFTDANQSEILSLTYDPTATSFKWPLFDGKYLVRFQPVERSLPCSLQSKGWNCSHPFHLHSDQCRLNMIYFSPSSLSQEIALRIGEPYSTKEGYQFTVLKNSSDDAAIRVAVDYSLLRKVWSWSFGPWFCKA